MEVAWLVIPSLFKIIIPNQAEARDLALKALNLLVSLKSKTDLRVRMLGAKLRLFLTSIYLFDKNDNSITIKTITSELENASKIQKDIADTNIHTALGCYIALAEAFLFFKIRKGHYLQNETIDRRRRLKKKFEDILALLKLADELATNLGATFSVEVGKIAILTSKVSLKNYSIERGIDIKVMEKLKTAISLFHAHKLKKLELIANYQYSKVVYK